MIKLTKRIDDPNGIVSKLIFEDDDAIAEAVAYKYKERGVVCFSVQSGCQVGCVFCGTGKKFIRNLHAEEMLYQIRESLKVIGKRDKIEIMSMSMGEPMDNWKEVNAALHAIMSYDEDTRFYLSTVGIHNTKAINAIITHGIKYKNFGLQISLHSADFDKRFKILGSYPRLLSKDSLLEFAQNWKTCTGKRCYFNYIATGKETEEDVQKICEVVDGQHLTCSVMCNTTSLKKGEIDPAFRLMDMCRKACVKHEYDIDVSTFDPAGQDTVGGGCGQLLYVQEKLHGKA